MSPTISPDFKAYVAATLRLQADTNEARQDHTEAARLRREAEKLERQVKETVQ
jgi:hypothetical protein